MVGMAIGKNVLSNVVGYRFHPTDQEIVSYYLKNKMLGNDHLLDAIRHVDICKHDPWELPSLSALESDDPEWFFFSTLDLKHCNGRRLNRKTRNGFWKPTGNDRKIKAEKTKKLIGTKKTLVFHEGRAPNAVRTNWVIHEYHSVENHPQKAMYVVCLLKKKDEEEVDKLACEYVDCDSQCGPNESAITEVLPVENGGLPFTLPLQEAYCDHPNGENDIDMERMNEVLISVLDDPALYELLLGDLPPTSSEISECSSWSFQSQIQMLRNVGGGRLQSHLRYVEQDNVYRRIEFSGQANSGRAPSRIQLQQKSGNTAGNPIKAEESSKHTRNHHPNEKETVARSPAEYFVNVIVGIVLFIVFVREMCYMAEWGM